MTTAPDREWLLANLPHQGRMSLLRKIVSWDATTLHALADGHRETDHPLRRGGELPIAAGIEYGAQAAAAHGALNAGTPSPAVLVASVRGVSLPVAQNSACLRRGWTIASSEPVTGAAGPLPASV